MPAASQPTACTPKSPADGGTQMKLQELDLAPELPSLADELWNPPQVPSVCHHWPVAWFLMATRTPVTPTLSLAEPAIVTFLRFPETDPIDVFGAVVSAGGGAVVVVVVGGGGAVVVVVVVGGGGGAVVVVVGATVVVVVGAAVVVVVGAAVVVVVDESRAARISEVICSAMAPRSATRRSSS